MTIPGEYFRKVCDNTTTFMIDIEIQSIEKHDSYQNNDDFYEEIINFDQ